MEKQHAQPMSEVLLVIGAGGGQSWNFSSLNRGTLKPAQFDANCLNQSIRGEEGRLLKVECRILIRRDGARQLLSLGNREYACPLCKK